MILNKKKNNNNQGVFLKLLVAAKKTSPAIYLKTVVQTDRQTESISECTLKDLSNDIQVVIGHTYQSRHTYEENNIPPPLHYRGGINIHICI